MKLPKTGFELQIFGIRSKPFSKCRHNHVEVVYN